MLSRSRQPLKSALDFPGSQIHVGTSDCHGRSFSRLLLAAGESGERSSWLNVWGKDNRSDGASQLRALFPRNSSKRVGFSGTDPRDYEMPSIFGCSNPMCALSFRGLREPGTRGCVWDWSCGLTSLQTPLVTLGMGITQPPSSLLPTQRPPSSPLPNANANLIFPTCFHTPVPWSNTFCGSPFNFSLHYICPIKIKKQLLTYSTLEFT